MRNSARFNNQNWPKSRYYIAVKTNDGKTLYKIGITNLTVERRFPVIDRARIRVVKIWRFDVGHYAAEREAKIISQFARDRYYGPAILVGSGNTELFTKDILGLDKEFQEIRQAVVDSEANLIARPIQLNLGLLEA